MNQRKGDVINLKRRHKSFMNKPKTGINAPGQVSFQSDGIMDGLAEGFLEGLEVGGGALLSGQAVAGSAVSVRQQQNRLAPGKAAPQFDVGCAV
jgi:hypothetical protein